MRCAPSRASRSSAESSRVLSCPASFSTTFSIGVPFPVPARTARLVGSNSERYATFVSSRRSTTFGHISWLDRPSSGRAAPRGDRLHPFAPVVGPWLCYRSLYRDGRARTVAPAREGGSPVPRGPCGVRSCSGEVGDDLRGRAPQAQPVSQFISVASRRPQLRLDVLRSPLPMLYAPPMLLPISIALMVAAVPEKSPLPDALALKKMTARLAPVDLEVDISKLPQPERAALAKMLEAAQIMDPLFLRQSWSGNETLFFTLAQDKSPLGQERLHAFFQNKGPWDRIDLNRPFIPGVPEEKPPSGNFYPAGATKADVEKWMKSLPEARRQQAAGFFTTIRRDAAGKFHIVPYSVEYQGELARAASLLREAAQLADEPTLRDFLSKRADAFLSNDYYASDVAWM